MAIVNDCRLEAIASFIVNNEVNGNCACCSILDQMPEEMQKEVSAPCKSSNYEDEWCYDCPFYSKEAFLYWIKKPNNGLKIREIKKPKQMDFFGYSSKDNSLLDKDSYIKSLEKYCNDLENILADDEYDLDSAECENKALIEKLSKIRDVLDEGY